MQDIEFIDIIEYDPQKLAAPPYRMRITTKLPSAGERVRPCRRPHALQRVGDVLWSGEGASCNGMGLVAILSSIRSG